MSANDDLAYILLPRCVFKLARLSASRSTNSLLILGSTAHHARIMRQECNYASSR